MAGSNDQKSSERPIVSQTSPGVGGWQPRVFNIVGPQGRPNVLDNTGTLQPDRTDTVILYEGRECKQTRHVEYDLKIEQETRKKEFEKVDSRLRESYFPNDCLTEGENEVLKLEKALPAISNSLGHAPMFSQEKWGKLRKVRVGEAMLWFFWNGKKWSYLLSGITIFIANVYFSIRSGGLGAIAAGKLGGKAAGKFGVKTVGKVIAEKSSEIIVNVSNATSYIVDGIEVRLGLIGRRELEERVSKINAAFNIRGNKKMLDITHEASTIMVTNAIDNRKALLELGKVCGFNVDNVARSLRVSLGEAGKYDEWKTIGNVLAALNVAGAALSEMPFIYQITEKLFSDLFSSETLDATYKKFGIYAAIVEDMVNKRILGWKGGTTWIKWLKREIEDEIPMFKAGYDKYFQDLKISAKEISDAIEILDESVVDIEYCDVSKPNKTLYNNVKVGDKNAYLKKNQYGALKVEGNGAMYDYNEMDENYKYRWIWTLGKMKGLIVKECVTRIGNMAFKRCKELPSVTIRNGVKEIGKEAFKECTALKSITIPGTVTVIEEKAFEGCFALANVVISEGVETIGAYAFAGCFSLSSIIIPESVNKIDEGAFQGCVELKHITIPRKKTIFIDAYAFDRCLKLTAVNCLAVEAPFFSKTTFPEKTTIYVRKESLEKYRDKQKQFHGSYSNVKIQQLPEGGI